MTIHSQEVVTDAACIKGGQIAAIKHQATQSVSK